MHTRAVKFISAILVFLFIITAVVFGTANCLIEDRQSLFVGEKLNSYSFASLEAREESVTVSSLSQGCYVRSIKMTAKLFDMIPLKTVTVDYFDKSSLYVGGFPFGIKFYTDGIVVVGFNDIQTESGSQNPAYNAGIRTNDIITKCNGKKLSDAGELTSIIEKSNGKELTITYSRGGSEYIVSLTPLLSKNDGAYKTGMWIKDSGAGIGTVTYINPTDNSFAGLGHGICDSQTGELIPMQKGTLMDVTLNGIVKGTAGTPGELKGYFDGGKSGVVLSNTECGVFGIYTSIPKEAKNLYKIALKNEIRDGKATVLCTVDDSGIGEYDIEISQINRDSTSNKCFTVKVTDKMLIEKTGGIVQGMSGSPIIQNGKLIGAITHVMVNDPTTGYGIFIENMLGAAS